MRPIIFLDIDGPLATWESYEVKVEHNGRRYSSLHRPAVERLQHIVARTGAEIVLSSSWRSDIEEVWRDVKSYLQSQGVPPLIDRTPDLFPERRGIECQAWLDTCRPAASAIAIDDDSDLDPIPLIHIRDGMANGGLLERHATEAIAMLRRGAPRGGGG